MQKLQFSILFSCLLSNLAIGQLTNNGGTIFIETGGVVHAEMDVVNTNSGFITNNGTIVLEDLHNALGSTIEGDGTHEVQGNWMNSGIFNANLSTVIFSGTGNSDVSSGGNPFNIFSVEKSNGINVNVLDDIILVNDLNFLSENNKLILHNQMLSIGGAINGYDNNDYIITNGIGKLTKLSLDALPYVFPVGFNGTSFNPLTITNFGVVDDIGVRALENTFDGGSVGSPVQEFAIDVSWDVAELAPGGSDLTLTVQWSASDELPGFDRLNCEVLKFIAPNWELDGGTIAVANGTGPFTKSKTSVSAPGTFTVGHEFLFVNVKIALDVLLGGPYAGAGAMNANLRTLPSFPLVEPYSGYGYTHFGSGGGETIDPSVLTVTGNDAIVDWVFIELRDMADNTNIIATRSALLQADGDVVDRDGMSDLQFNGVGDGAYYIAIRHRNHLGASTLNSIPLSRIGTSVDFKSGSTAVYGTNALEFNDDGFKTLWAGDANGDGKVIFAGPSDDPGEIFFDVLLSSGNPDYEPNYIVNGYNNSDVNMNGNTIFSGPGNDPNTVFFKVLLHPESGFTENFIINEQLPH